MTRWPTTTLGGKVFRHADTGGADGDAHLALVQAAVEWPPRDDPRSAGEERDAWWSHEQACVSEGTCPYCLGSLCRSVLSPKLRLIR